MKKIKDEDTSISRLPDEILHHILSYLPFELAFQTSFLSKRWKRIWDTLPYINLSKTFAKTSTAKVLNFIDNYLLMHHVNKICIQRFEIKIPYCDSQLALYMNTWFERLSRNCNIRELSFSNWFINPSNYFSFPQSILLAESLSELRLSGCLLVLDVGVDIKLMSLRFVYLKHVLISQGLVEKLVESCARLEVLSLEHCDGFSSLKVKGLLWLKELKLNHNRNLQRVEIYEPSLLHIYYDGGYNKKDSIEFADCINLKTLHLSRTNITEERLNEQLLALEKLEDLTIISCPEITSLNISGPCLRNLNLKLSEEYFEAINIIAPNLQFFTLKRQCVSKFTKTLSLSLDAPPTLKVKYTFLIRNLGPTTFIELLKFLSIFNSSQLILATNIPNSRIPQEWTNYFLRMKSLTQFKRFWVAPDARLLDVIRSLCHVNGRVVYCGVQILTGKPIEVDDYEELQSCGRIMDTLY